MIEANVICYKKKQRTDNLLENYENSKLIGRHNIIRNNKN